MIARVPRERVKIKQLEVKNVTNIFTGVILSIFIEAGKIIFLKYPFSSCSECAPYAEETCRDVANSLEGLTFIHAGGWYSTKGCFAYVNGNVYYGTGGTPDQRKSLLSSYPWGKYPRDKYRPFGHDCKNSGI